MPPAEPPAPHRGAPSAAELSDAFGRTAKLLGGRLAARLEDHGLSMPRFSLLAALDAHGPSRITQLGELVGVSQGTASSLVDSLVRDELIERRVDPDDARAALLAITHTGRERARAWRADYERAAEEIFAPLSSTQRSALLGALTTLVGTPAEDPRQTS